MSKLPLSLIFFLVIFLFISPLLSHFSFAATMSNCVETNMNDAPTNAPGGCSNTDCGTTAPSTLTDIVNKLKPDGIDVKGDEVNAKNAAEVFNTWCLLKKSSMYVKLLGASTSDPIEIRFMHTYESQGAHAYACAGFSSAVIKPRFVELYGAQVGAQCADYRLDFLIAHELGHQIRFRNDHIFQMWVNNPRYNNPSFPTWNCTSDYGPGHWSEECFPDMIAEYVFYKKWKMFTAPQQPFPEMKTTYIDMYNFTKDNIFGGVEY